MNHLNKEIMNIAKDFSPYPGPRNEDEGDYSGASFRKNMLVPALQKAISNNHVLVVILDGTAGYGTFFLEEAFGGLIRTGIFDYDTICRHLELLSNDEPYLIDDIKAYMQEAVSS
jgi:hypothetical protein